MNQIRNQINPPKNKIEELIYKYYPDIICLNTYTQRGAWYIEYHFNRQVINSEPGICTLTEFFNKFGGSWVEQRKTKMIII